MDRDPQKGSTEFSLARTALATAALNVGILAAGGQLPHGELPTAHLGLGDRVELTADANPGTPNGTDETTASELSFVESYTVGEQWARQFAEDPRAGELIKQNETPKVASSIKELLTDNKDCKIDSIEISGQASDDDDSTNSMGERTAGLGQPDADGENIKLAEKRSTVFEDNLRNELSAQGVDADKLPIIQMPGVEDILTADEISQVNLLASQFGYDSPTDMIERFNRDPDNAPPAVVEYLNTALKAERNVTIQIKGTCVDESITGSTTTEGLPTIHLKEVKKELQVTLPWFMIIPVPLFKRRRAEADVDDPVIVPTVLPPVPPESIPVIQPRRVRRGTPPRDPGNIFDMPKHDKPGKYSGPDRGPKRYVGPNVGNGVWHV